MTMLLKVTSTGGSYPEPGLPRSAEGGYSDRMDRGERPGASEERAAAIVSIIESAERSLAQGSIPVRL